MKKTFRKEERLCSRSQIDELFRSGSSFVVYPFRVVLLVDKDSSHSGVQVILSVSKRKFKRAIARNKIKRKMREAYRSLKGEILYPLTYSKSTHLLLALQYIVNEDLPFDQYLQKMNKALNQILHEID